jgi:hypothetical protein
VHILTRSIIKDGFHCGGGNSKQNNVRLIHSLQTEESKAMMYPAQIFRNLSGATGLRLDVSDHAPAIGLLHGFPMDFAELAVFDDALQHFWSFRLYLA